METLPINELQLQAARMFADERGGIAWWRVGQGKTRIAIATFLLYPLKNVTSHFVVFCRPESFDDWRNDATVMGLDPSRLVLRSYAQLQAQSAEATVRDVVNDGRVGMVCFDELYLFKNPKSNRSQMAHKIAKVKPCVGLSGSIMTAQRLEDVYGQAWAVNKHKRIAESMTSFREQYLIGINEFGGMRFTPQRGSYQRLMEACSSFAHVYMPKKSERIIKESVLKVDVTSQQETYFKDLQDTLSLPELGIELSSAASLIIKVQQAADGWIRGHAEDEEPQITPVTSNKPKRCLALVEELIDAGERVVVWCAFRYDVSMLMAMAKEKRLKCCQMLGGEQFSVAHWNNSDVCFATEAMGSSVNHFAQVGHAIYFSLSQKWLDLQQSMGRTDRKSSLHDTCHYHYLVVDKSMDENILRRVRHAGGAEKGMLGLAHDMREWLNGNVTSQSNGTES